MAILEPPDEDDEYYPIEDEYESEMELLEDEDPGLYEGILARAEDELVGPPPGFNQGVDGDVKDDIPKE